MDRKPLIAWWEKHSQLIEFAGLTMVGPCVIYGLIFRSLTPHTDGQTFVAVGLAVAGMIVWVVRNA